MSPKIGITLAALILSACPSPNRGVDKSEAKRAYDASAVAQNAPKTGTYQCTWRQGEDTDQPKCEIQLQEGKKTFMLTMSELSLRGTATATTYGFHFVGTLKSTANKSDEKLEADFFRQGQGSYSTVLTLKDKSLVKLDLGPRS